MTKPLIEIERIIEPKDATKKAHIETETISVDDVISFRRWKKSEKDEWVKGEITQLTLISHGRDGGMWTTNINESEKEFSQRIGRFRPVISL